MGWRFAPAPGIVSYEFGTRLFTAATATIRRLTITHLLLAPACSPHSPSPPYFFTLYEIRVWCILRSTPLRSLSQSRFNCTSFSRGDAACSSRTHTSSPFSLWLFKYSKCDDNGAPFTHSHKHTTAADLAFLSHVVPSLPSSFPPGNLFLCIHMWSSPLGAVVSTRRHRAHFLLLLHTLNVLGCGCECAFCVWFLRFFSTVSKNV